MFYGLAIALCLAVLFLILVFTSALMVPAVLAARRMVHSAPESLAGLLFFARLLPILLACCVALGLALPAFLAFEPHSTNEPIGLQLDVLALAGALILVVMAFRCWHVLRDTDRGERCWREGAERIQIAGIDLPVFQVKGSSSVLAVAGIFWPRVYVSRAVVESLSSAELRAALAHEIAHATSFDNLKQLLLRITRAPRWLKQLHAIDHEWSSAAEIAADQNALADGASVLDLSSALVKVGRLYRAPATVSVVASHLVSPGCNSALEQRITRLAALLQGSAPVSKRKTNKRAIVLTIAALAAAYIACIHIFLPSVHE